jgi:hypothetical protein
VVNWLECCEADPSRARTQKLFWKDGGRNERWMIIRVASDPSMGQQHEVIDKSYPRVPVLASKTCPGRSERP